LVLSKLDLTHSLYRQQSCYNKSLLFMSFGMRL